VAALLVASFAGALPVCAQTARLQGSAAPDSLAGRGAAESRAGQDSLAAPVVPAGARDSLAGPTPRGGIPVDSTADGFDLRRYRIAPLDSTKVRFHRGRFDAPRWVMLRSLAVPGWGQLHNGSWLKALALGGGEIALITGILQDNGDLDGLRAAAERARVESDEATYAAAVQAYNDRLDRMTSREWLLGGVMVYALMDAYVDAHFRDFKIEFEYDPALPQGTPGPGGARLTVGWAF
jgi:hypothetical protein